MTIRERQQLILPPAAASLALTVVALMMLSPAVAKSSSRTNPRAGRLSAAKQPPRRLAQNVSAAELAGAATKPTPPSAPANKATIPAPAPIKAEAVTPAAPSVDTALLSVLKDLSKAARQSDDVEKLDDPAQKAAIKAALEAVDAALITAKVNPDRIVAATDKNRFEKTLSAESWDSGLMSLPNNVHGSLSILWAKKVNGLVNVSIAGNCLCRGDGSARIGEYVVVINGKSVLDSGFDIQSQSDVSFWLGKLTGINADATTCGDSAGKIGATPVLKSVATEDWVRRQTASVDAQQADLDRLQQLATQQAVAQHMAAQQSPLPSAATPQTGPLPGTTQVAAGAPAPTAAILVVPGQIRNVQESVIVLPELKPPISVPTSDSP